MTKEEAELIVLFGKELSSKPVVSSKSNTYVSKFLSDALYYNSSGEYEKSAEALMHSFSWGHNNLPLWANEYKNLIGGKPLSRDAEAQLVYWRSLL